MLTCRHTNYLHSFTIISFTLIIYLLCDDTNFKYSNISKPSTLNNLLYAAFSWHLNYSIFPLFTCYKVSILWSSCPSIYITVIVWRVRERENCSVLYWIRQSFTMTCTHTHTHTQTHRRAVFTVVCWLRFTLCQRLLINSNNFFSNDHFREAWSRC